MKTSLALSFLLLIAEMLTALAAPQVTAPMKSVSGQFVIHDQRGTLSPRPLPQTKGQQILDLEPPFLVVSCERIKQALYVELGLERHWSGTIHAAIRPSQGGQGVAQINVERFGPMWKYQLNLPQQIERSQFIRTLVQVLLLEIANRTATDRSAEIPLWLSEGLTQRLLASREVELILPPPTMAVGAMLVDPQMFVKRDPDPLEAARRVLQNHPTPTLEQLSWPALDKFSPEEAEVFKGSAQLLVAELLRLKNGPERLRVFVTSLAQFYNWQTAFLRTYQAHFENQLALEKWWTLQAAFFVGRDHQHLWTLEESAQKLDAILHASIAIRTSANELPARSDVSLQGVIREWDTVRQLATLPGKLNDLAEARRRVAPQFMMLVNDYAVVLDEYIKERKKSASTFGNFFSLSPSIKKVAAETMRQLDVLDVRRAQILTDAAQSPTNSTNAVSAIR